MWLDTLWLLDEVSVIKFTHWIYFWPIDLEHENLKLIIVNICIEYKKGDVLNFFFFKSRNNAFFYLVLFSLLIYLLFLAFFPYV